MFKKKVDYKAMQDQEARRKARQQGGTFIHHPVSKSYTCNKCDKSYVNP